MTDFFSLFSADPQSSTQTTTEAHEGEAFGFFEEVDDYFNEQIGSELTENENDDTEIETDLNDTDSQAFSFDTSIGNGTQDTAHRSMKRGDSNNTHVHSGDTDMDVGTSEALHRIEVSQFISHTSWLCTYDVLT